MCDDDQCSKCQHISESAKKEKQEQQIHNEQLQQKFEADPDWMRRDLEEFLLDFLSRALDCERFNWIVDQDVQFDENYTFTYKNRTFKLKLMETIENEI